jgi:hypothetical protein
VSVVGADDPLVYYIRRSGLIKIGFTTRFVSRMRRLRPDELLAVEPGNLALELGRHRQFAAFRVPHDDGREWFAPEPELLEHIAGMTQLYEAPPLPVRQPRLPRQPEPPEEPFVPGPDALSIYMRLAAGELDADQLSVDELLSAAWVAVHSKLFMSAALSALNDRGETFAQIGKRLGVHEATASRWAKPPVEDLRRRRKTEQEATQP